MVIYLNIFSYIKSYIDDNELNIIVKKNKVNIQNYDNIFNFDSNKIVIVKDNEKVSIYGEDLYVSKLLDNEVLINGKIFKIELGDYNKK